MTDKEYQSKYNEYRRAQLALLAKIDKLRERSWKIEQQVTNLLRERADKKGKGSR